MKILYFIFLIMSAVFYPLFKDDLSFILLITLLIFPVVMQIILFITVKTLKLKISGFGTGAVRGEKMSLRLSVKNPLFLPISSLTVTMLYKSNGDSAYKKYTVAIPIKAHSTETVAINLKAEHCGSIECKIKKVSVFDLIGLFSHKIKLNYHCEIAVLPCEIGCRAYVDNVMDCDSDTTSFSEQKAGSDPSEVFGLRDYRDGDRMNRIHWKLSSRSDSFVVKELSDSVSGNVLLIPDVKACREKGEIDNVMDVYASLARFLINEGTGCKVLTLQNEEMTYRKIETDTELDILLVEQVKTIQLYHNSLTMTESFSTECLTASRDADARFSHIIIITPTERKTALTELEQIGRSDKITVLCTGNDGDVEEDKNSDVIIYNINKNGSIEIPENFSV